MCMLFFLGEKSEIASYFGYLAVIFRCIFWIHRFLLQAVMKSQNRLKWLLREAQSWIFPGAHCWGKTMVFGSKKNTHENTFPRCRIVLGGGWIVKPFVDIKDKRKTPNRWFWQASSLELCRVCLGVRTPKPKHVCNLGGDCHVGCGFPSNNMNASNFAHIQNLQQTV